MTDLRPLRLRGANPNRALLMVALLFIIGCVSQHKIDKLNIDIGRAAAPVSAGR